jgi:hypothetical protein
MISNDTKKVMESLQVDLCVVGGGMAGLCAALAAARNGLQVVLVQDRPVLGGNASSEIRMWICGAHGADNKEGGVLEEILLDNLYHNPNLTFTLWDHVLYGKCLEEKNLKVLLNCSVQAVVMDGARIAAVRAWHLTRQCQVEIKATLFADCSGDSILRLSGAEFRWGREGREEFGESHAPAQPDLKTMGNSILLQLREVDKHVPFIPPVWAHVYTEADLPKRNLTPPCDNFWWLEIGGTQNTITDADAIRDELLKMAYGVWALVKNHPDGRGHRWELDWIGLLPGKRENVRYVGDHILTQNDVEAEGRFEDRVAYGGWSMDDHHPEAIKYPGAPTIFHPAPAPYGIPYRCLYSRNITNLFFAGRNISATHMAMSSTRVMASCALMGQAVGTAAAIAVRNHLTPRGVYEKQMPELINSLMDQDSYQPWRTRPIPEPCRSATLTASSGDAEVLRNGIERDLAGVDHGWWGESNDVVSYTWPVPLPVNRVRLVLDSDFTRNKRMLCCYPKDQQPAPMPPMLARDFEIECCDATGQWRGVAALRDNRRRLVTVPLTGAPITGCRLRINRSWGSACAHVFAFDVQ